MLTFPCLSSDIYVIATLTLHTLVLRTLVLHTRILHTLLLHALLLRTPLERSPLLNSKMLGHLLWAVALLSPAIMANPTITTFSEKGCPHGEEVHDYGRSVDTYACVDTPKQPHSVRTIIHHKHPTYKHCFISTWDAPGCPDTVNANIQHVPNISRYPSCELLYIGVLTLFSTEGKTVCHNRSDKNGIQSFKWGCH